MEENVALDSSKQKKFVKSIKGIKKLIKQKNESEKEEPVLEKVKKGRITKRKRKERGLVYLSHIPHGFYEREMTEYFKQFGLVTNARVIRSKRTGNSKGCAFVEFSEPSVAQIVADTMNNYLMGKRLLKAAYIPPEKQRRAKRMNWNDDNNPGNNMRMKMKKAHNADRDEKGEMKRVRKILANLEKTRTKLQELGINYDFFTPVDMPEALKVEDAAKDITNKQTDAEEEKVSTKQKKKVEGVSIPQKESMKRKKTAEVVTMPHKKSKTVKTADKPAGIDTMIPKEETEPENVIPMPKIKGKPTPKSSQEPPAPKQKGNAKPQKKGGQKPDQQKKFEKNVTQKPRNKQFKKKK